MPAITSEVILLFLNLYLHFLFSIWNPRVFFLLWPYPILKYNSWQLKSSYTFSVQEQKPGSYCERNSISTEDEDFKRLNENLYLKLHFLLNTEFPKNRMTLNIRWPLIFLCMYFSAWRLLTSSPHPPPHSSLIYSYTLHTSIKFSISHSLTFLPSYCTSPFISLLDKMYSVSYVSCVLSFRALAPLLLLIFWMCCGGGSEIIAYHCWKPCQLAFLSVNHHLPNHLFLTISANCDFFLNHV